MQARERRAKRTRVAHVDRRRDARRPSPTNDSGRTIHIGGQIEHRWRSNFVLALTKVVWLRISVVVLATTPRADFGRIATNDRDRQSFNHSFAPPFKRTDV
ncbi:hypothetical protein N9D08_01610 [bacterium]|jgi:hypothetical protein|nr:hypothetical protein [bacterium]